MNQSTGFNNIIQIRSFLSKIIILGGIILTNFISIVKRKECLTALIIGKFSCYWLAALSCDSIAFSQWKGWISVKI